MSTIEEITDYIANARQRGSESLVGFHWPANQVHYLSDQLDTRMLELDEMRIRRFEYDYESETVYIDIRGESPVHHHVRSGLAGYLNASLAKALYDANDLTIRRLIRSVVDYGTITIDYGNKLLKRSDISFGQTATIPSLVCEVS